MPVCPKQVVAAIRVKGQFLELNVGDKWQLLELLEEGVGTDGAGGLGL